MPTIATLFLPSSSTSALAKSGSCMPGFSRKNSVPASVMSFTPVPAFISALALVSGNMVKPTTIRSRLIFVGATSVVICVLLTLCETCLGLLRPQAWEAWDGGLGTPYLIRGCACRHLLPIHLKKTLRSFIVPASSRRPSRRQAAAAPALPTVKTPTLSVSMPNRR